MAKKLITIITPCYNEELNVREVHRRVMAMAAEFPNIDSSIYLSTMRRKTARLPYFARWLPKIPASK